MARDFFYPCLHWGFQKLLAGPQPKPAKDDRAKEEKQCVSFTVSVYCYSRWSCWRCRWHLSRKSAYPLTLPRLSSLFTTSRFAPTKGISGRLGTGLGTATIIIGSLGLG